ncbi:hypothetical protein M427DRAFT_54528 [Gonapodya prolifera JEL478]|uniref:EXPERA domain-containing protein n=1 Tax=Gonapodya prolifera (strain JEL478) TaxID=1344416 RepID=A0A139ALN0_GONPJ|nr:hypothetical protein M427DRAFT_54528 [Gonapodya prolifera JEL478]|eukprot:KXS17598.1 hypothetical protein M427DRAFT_54528 [Gonapodya prolifera JEL478]
MSTPIPLSKRPADLAFFAFFFLHVPASILDGPIAALSIPALSAIFPQAINDFQHKAWIDHTGDPFILAAEAGAPIERAFVVIETLVLIPMMIGICIRLYSDDKRLQWLSYVYALYAAPTMSYVLYQTLIADHGLSVMQKLQIASAYVPFALVPISFGIYEWRVRAQERVKSE